MSARVVAIFDKFRGTLTQGEIVESLVELSLTLGIDIDTQTVSDGGEGFADCFSGDENEVTVSDPFGFPRRVTWKQAGERAVVEVAKVIGYGAVGSRRCPLGTSSFGVGELLALILRLGIRDIAIGCGGSATSDGGFGLISALGGRPFSEEVSVRAFVDTTSMFGHAPRVFAPQKGASTVQVALLERRFAYLDTLYKARFGGSVNECVGSGSAGGVSGALWALGAEITMAVDSTVKSPSVASSIAVSDLVLTGEGYFDLQSLRGKVVGAVLEASEKESKPVLVVAGDADRDMKFELQKRSPSVQVVSLVEEFGYEAAVHDTKRVLLETVARYVTAHYGPR